MDNFEIQRRVIALERMNQRYAILLALCLAGLCGLGVAGTTGVHEPPDVVTARSFQLVDQNGKMLAVLHTRSADTAELTMYRADSLNPLVRLSAEKDGGLLSLYSSGTQEKDDTALRERVRIGAPHRGGFASFFSDSAGDLAVACISANHEAGGDLSLHTSDMSGQIDLSPLARVDRGGLRFTVMERDPIRGREVAVFGSNGRSGLLRILRSDGSPALDIGGEIKP